MQWAELAGNPRILIWFSVFAVVMVFISTTTLGWQSANDDIIWGSLRAIALVILAGFVADWWIVRTKK